MCSKVDQKISTLLHRDNERFVLFPGHHFIKCHHSFENIYLKHVSYLLQEFFIGYQLGCTFNDECTLSHEYPMLRVNVICFTNHAVLAENINFELRDYQVNNTIQGLSATGSTYLCNIIQNPAPLTPPITRVCDHRFSHRTIRVILRVRSSKPRDDH